jgi:hypothetical protein
MNRVMTVLFAGSGGWHRAKNKNRHCPVHPGNPAFSMKTTW